VIGARVGSSLGTDVPDGDWYFRWFTKFGMMAPYCNALQGGLNGSFSEVPANGIIPDHRLCTRKGKPATDPSWLAFVREAEDVDGKPHFHMMDVDAGDQWTGKRWGLQGSFPKDKKSRNIQKSDVRDGDVE
jgi:hypothetical protein